MRYIKAKSISYGKKRNKKDILYIVIHYTGVKGDTAVGEATYFARYNKVSAGAHFFVDRKGNIVKSIAMDLTAWSVGGSKYTDCHKTGGGRLHGKVTNFNSVSIELCDILDQLPSEAQIKATRKCIDYIQKYCPNATKIVRHFDITGKRCLPIEETELLTPQGWVYLRDVRKGDIVCQYDAEKDSLSFAPVLDVVKQHSADVLENHHFIATPDHRMYLKPNSRNSSKYRDMLWGDALIGNRLLAVKSGALIETEGMKLTDDELKLLVWIQGDGHYIRDDGKIRGLEFHLKKPRKITRIKSLLDSLDIQYAVSICTNGSEHIRVYDPEIVEWAEQWLDEKRFTYGFINMSEYQFDVFREEMTNVDGCKSGRKELYTSIIPQNLDVVQAICATHGVRTNQQKLGSDYRCAVALHTSNHTFTGRTETKKRKAIVSCVTVPTGYILVRQNWRTFIVGNCPATMINNDIWNNFKQRL